MLYNLGAQTVCIDVGVYLCSANIFVPEHALDHPQVGPALEQMSCKGVTQSVRADAFLDTRHLCQLSDDVEEGDARKLSLAMSTYEEKILMSRFYGYRRPLCHVVHNLCHGTL